MLQRHIQPPRLSRDGALQPGVTSVLALVAGVTLPGDWVWHCDCAIPEGNCIG